MATQPCPYEMIEKMVTQGVFGDVTTGEVDARYDPFYSPGIGYCFMAFKGNWGQMARCYNSGWVIDPLHLENAGPSATAAYVSDIGNRLLGQPVIWDDITSQCHM